MKLLRRAGEQKAERSGDRFDSLPGFKPIIGGLRHLTDEDTASPAGAVIPLLCGGLYQVSDRKKSPYVYDCSACWAVYTERSGA